MQRRYSITVGGLSSCKLTLRDGETSRIVLPGDMSGKLVLYEGDRIDLVARDTNSGAYEIRLSGLVSDRQVVDLYGAFELEVATESAELNFPVNLKTNSDPVLELESAAISLVLIRNLYGHDRIDMSFTGSATVRKALSGGEAAVSADTSTAKISAEVFTVLTDWINEPFSEIADLTLDKLIYKEV